MHGHHEATMGLAGPSLGRELRARALSHTAPWARVRNTSLAPSRPLCSKITPPPPRATLHALHWMQCQRTLRCGSEVNRMVNRRRPTSAGVTPLSTHTCGLYRASSLPGITGNDFAGVGRRHRAMEARGTSAMEAQGTSPNFEAIRALCTAPRRQEPWRRQADR